MHVLVARRRTQGMDPDDYSGAMDGELVLLSVGDRDPRWTATQRTRGRHFLGLESRAPTTTAEIIDLDVTASVVIGYVREVLSRDRSRDADALTAAAHQLGTEMLELARHFAVGTVVEKRGELVIARSTGAH